MPNPGEVARLINNKNKGLISQSLIIQAYAVSANEQPQVNFSGDKKLEPFQIEINTYLTKAKINANNYLNKIVPSMIVNINNISNYFALHNAIATQLPHDSSINIWIQSLKVLKDISIRYQQKAEEIVILLKILSDKLTVDSAAFENTVDTLSNTVNVDKEELSIFDKKMKNITTNIDGTIVGEVFSGLGLIGCAVLILLGETLVYYTGLGKTPLIIGSVGLLLAGTGGATVSAITQIGLLKQKREVNNKESRVKAEVKLATGICNAFRIFSKRIGDAIKAADQMGNAWSFLKNDLDSTVKNIKEGIMSTKQVRTILLTAENGVIKAVLDDINIIKNQMTGVNVINKNLKNGLDQTIIDTAKTIENK